MCLFLTSCSTLPTDVSSENSPAPLPVPPLLSFLLFPFLFLLLLLHKVKQTQVPPYSTTGAMWAELSKKILTAVMKLRVTFHKTG